MCEELLVIMSNGFHPFKGRVSRHFGEKVWASSILTASATILFLYYTRTSQEATADMLDWLREKRKSLTRYFAVLKLHPDDAYLSCKSAQAHI